MTLSRGARLKDLNRALELTLAQLGEQAIDKVLFDVDCPPFAEIKPTTWEELSGRHLIERLDGIGAAQFRLTGPGWCSALEVTGRRSAPDVVQRVAKLAAALKASVKGRREDAFVSVDALASQSGISGDWVFNAIESDILARWCHMKSASWEPHSIHGTLVRVPLGFGMDCL
jgi:hypothetical protein